MAKGLFSKIFSFKKDEEQKHGKEEITYVLKVIEGDDTGKIFDLGHEAVSIGRRLPNDTRVNDILITDTDATISTEQSRICWDSSRNMHLINFVAGTKNPTIVDGKIVVGLTPIQEGSQIVMGRNALKYLRKDQAFMFATPQQTQKKPSFSNDDSFEFNSGYFLKIISPFEEGKIFKLNTHLIPIGKVSEDEKIGWILLSSPDVAEDQATLKWMRDVKKFGIIHTSSARFPTLVNNEHISSDDFALLSEGDIIQIGQNSLLVSTGNVETKPPEPAGARKTFIRKTFDNMDPEMDEFPSDASRKRDHILSNYGNEQDMDMPDSRYRATNRLSGMNLQKTEYEEDYEDEYPSEEPVRRASVRYGTPNRSSKMKLQQPEYEEGYEDEYPPEEPARRGSYRDRGGHEDYEDEYPPEEPVRRGSYRGRGGREDYEDEYPPEEPARRGSYRGRGGREDYEDEYPPEEPARRGSYRGRGGREDYEDEYPPEEPARRGSYRGRGGREDYEDEYPPEEPARRGSYRGRGGREDYEDEYPPEETGGRGDGRKKSPFSQARVPAPKDYREDEIEDEDDEDDRTTMDKTMVVSWKEGHEFRVIKGPDTGRVYFVSKEMIQDKLIIGRKGARRKDIEVNDPSVSEYHASLIFEQNWLYISLDDKKSSLRINDMPVKRKKLDNGDIITIGDTLLFYNFLGSREPFIESTVEVLEGLDKGKIFRVTKDITRVGRKSKKKGQEKEIELSEDDRSISRNHLYIEKKDSVFYLINEKPSNITLLNGVQIEDPRPLVDNDKIKLGETTLLLFKCKVDTGETYESPDEEETENPMEEKKAFKPQEEKKAFKPQEEKKAFKPQEEKKAFKPQEEKKAFKPQEEKISGPEEKKSFKPQKEKKIPETFPVKEEKVEEIPVYEEEDMAYIPGGPFLMGIDGVECDSSPGHKVTVEDFYIDIYPVTNIQYADFVSATGYESEGNWEDYYTEGKDYYPVVGVTYNDGQAYATWLGKRLPSEAEWEKAARSEDGFLYPWGNVWSPSNLSSKEGGHGAYGEVDMYPEGASPYGIMDMLGNVWEWTCDHYGEYPYKSDPVQDIEREVVIRGGDWLTELKDLGATIRAGIFADEFGDSVGFRCVKSVRE